MHIGQIIYYESWFVMGFFPFLVRFIVNLNKYLINGMLKLPVKI